MMVCGTLKQQVLVLRTRVYNIISLSYRDPNYLPVLLSMGNTPADRLVSAPCLLITSEAAERGRGSRRTGGISQRGIGCGHP